jgi:hypothetical protein
MGRWPAWRKFLQRKGMTGQADGERYMNMAGGGSPKAGRNIALADDIVGENAQSNGVIASVTGPKRRSPERPAGFPELSMHIVDMFSAGDKLCYASRLARDSHQSI